MKKIINPWAKAHVEGYNCFGCSPDNAQGLRMEFYEDGDEIVSFWKPESHFQGWYNTLHGGIQASLMDEISSWVVSRKLQCAAVTSRMEMKYKKPVSTNDKQITLRASIKEQRRNIVTIEARLYNGQNELCTTAKVIYFAFSKDKSENEMSFLPCLTEDEIQQP